MKRIVLNQRGESGVDMASRLRAYHWAIGQGIPSGNLHGCGPGPAEWRDECRAEWDLGQLIRAELVRTGEIDERECEICGCLLDEAPTGQGPYVCPTHAEAS